MFDFHVPQLTATVLGGALFIFFLRVIDVSLGTMRIMLVTRGVRGWAALIGFVEVTIWVVAVSQVIANLNNVWNLLGYGGGFASGTLLGMYLEDRLAMGYVTVYAISVANGSRIVDRIREANFLATELPAQGRSGPVSLVGVVVSRRQLPEILALIGDADPDAFVTVDDTRHVLRGYRRLAK